MGEFWGGFGRVLEPLGASCAVLGAVFFMLVLEWSSKVLLEASGLDFKSILKGLGKILGGGWEVFGKVLRGI